MNIKKSGITLGKAMISAIPYVGGTIASIWNELESMQVERKLQRFSELIENLQSDFEQIKGKVNEDFVTAQDCLDIFEKMSKFVVNERIKEKRNLYKNVYLHSMTAKTVDFDSVERNFRLIEQLNSLELHLLRIFDNPSKYDENIGNAYQNHYRDKNGNTTYHYQKNYYMLEEIMLMLPRGIKKENVLESMLFLSQNRILESGIEQKQLLTNGNPIDIFENALTAKGKTFVKLLKNI